MHSYSWKKIEALILSLNIPQVAKLSEDSQRKEAKWASTLAKLQEQVKFLERENQQLHEENHKLKLKTVSSKV